MLTEILTAWVSSLGEIITLLVGKPETPFSIHKDVLCGASPYFQEYCNPDLKLAPDMVIRLPNEDPIVIRTMCYWMYHNQICVPEYIARKPYHDPEPLETTTQGLFVKLFLAGQNYLIPDLGNDAIDGILYESHVSAREFWLLSHLKCSGF